MVLAAAAMVVVIVVVKGAVSEQRHNIGNRQQALKKCFAVAFSRRRFTSPVLHIPRELVISHASLN